jgi:hypothetical protein
VSGIGSGISSIFSGIGAQKEASGYKKAAAYATQEAQYAKLSTEIQDQQTERKNYQIAGATTAAAEGGDIAITGSALDTLRSNVEQGSLQKSLVTLQGKITETGYQAQAAADTAMASAANAKATGDFIGGALGIVGGLTVICTELFRQGHIPRSWYVAGARVASAYPAEVMEGYHVWAVPSVPHLRRYPNSFYSQFLRTIFTWYLGNIAAKAGIAGARKCWQGVVVTAIIWRLCYAVGWVRLSLNRLTDWKGLYSG